MSPYTRAVYHNQIAELLAEARSLAEKFPHFYGAVISGERRAVADRAAVLKPARSSFPPVQGWDRLPLVAAIQLDPLTCLYAGDEAGFMPYRRLATTIMDANLSCDPERGRPTEIQRTYAPEYIMGTMSVVGKVGLDGSGLAAITRTARHDAWHGECRVTAIRQGLFHATAYLLSATMAGLSIEPTPTEPVEANNTRNTNISTALANPNNVGVAPEPKPIKQKARLTEPSREAFQCHRLMVITGTEKTQTSIAKEVYRDAGKQWKVSRDLKAVKAWIEAGNVLPDMDESKPKTYSTDPSRIDKGRRQDTGRRGDG